MQHLFHSSASVGHPWCIMNMQLQKEVQKQQAVEKLCKLACIIVIKIFAI